MSPIYLYYAYNLKHITLLLTTLNHNVSLNVSCQRRLTTDDCLLNKAFELIFYKKK